MDTSCGGSDSGQDHNHGTGSVMEEIMNMRAPCERDCGCSRNLIGSVTEEEIADTAIIIVLAVC